MCAQYDKNRRETRTIIWPENMKKKGPVTRSRLQLKYNFKIEFEDNWQKVWIEWMWTRVHLLAFTVKVNWPSCSINGQEFLDQLRDNQVLKKGLCSVELNIRRVRRRLGAIECAKVLRLLDTITAKRYSLMSPHAMADD
jgi:hypothetical protein